MTVLQFKSEAEVELALPEVAAFLERGGVIAYPTETVYGLGCRLNEDDLVTLSALTDRPVGKPYLVLVAGEEMARDCGLSFTDAASRLADRFWPGPLTLVLSATGSGLPDSLRGTGGGIAVRWSSHPNTSRLIEGLGIPISSTSANRSGHEPLPDVGSIGAEFSRAFESGELMLLDGGRLASSSPSTLVDCTGVEPMVLREGAIASALVRECIEGKGR
jgi:L-threonylcarbamoyladenylate synthase